MDAPPWKDVDEPDFMPRIRRTFAELLPGRLERGRTALDRLTVDGPAEAEAHLEALRGVAHDLAGTASSMGAPELGRRALAITATLREAREAGTEVGDVAAELRPDWEALERQAERFLGWMDAEGEEGPGQEPGAG